VKFSEVCIDRPVLSTVMSLAILVFGAISLSRLPNRELPEVDPPIVSVLTVFPGAAPEVVETSVTQVLEDEIIAIEGIRHVTSNSREQASQITIEFDLSRDIDAAAADVRDRTARVRRLLPEEAEEPVVSKAEADARAVLWIALSGGGLDQVALSTLADTQVRDRLAKLPGVARVIFSGERRYSMRVWIDRYRLISHRLTIADVAAALRRENVDIPSGRVESADREFTVRTLGELKTPAEFGALIVANVEGQPVRLADLGRVEVGPQNERGLVRFNGIPAIGLGVVKQSKANTLDVVRAAKAELAAVAPQLPPGVQATVAFDSSTFIERSITDVTRTIFEAGLLVLVVIYLFLRSTRATLIPAAAIPVSIIGCLSFLYFAGYSINTLTLMGLTLAIGLVVDDAIVVLENISRWIEEGTPRMEAARRGMAEISFAVIASTVSTVAVFLPLAFLTDTTGRLFREFGVTVATAVAISGFVALTLSPALCARVLRSGHVVEHGVKLALARASDGLTATYARALAPTLRRAGLAAVVGVLWVALGFVLLRTIEQEFVPIADRATVVSFTRAPEGSTLEFTSRYQEEVEAILRSVPEVRTSFSIVSLGFGAPGLVNEGIVFSSLVPWEQRDRSQMEIVGELFPRYSEIPGVQAFPVNPATLGQNVRAAPVSLVVQGPDVRSLASYADEIARRAQQLPGFVNVQSDLLLNKPELEVQIDRERASDLGVSVREIASTLQILLGGLDLSTFKLEGETYDVIAQLERTERSKPRDLYGLYVRGKDGRLISLASLVRVREAIAPRGLPHYDRLRSATVTANLVSGTPLGTSLERMEATAKDVLPEGYRTTWSGESEQFFESGNAIVFAYLLAVVLIYLVLAAQFESFVDPLIILVAVALSFTGALLSLTLVGHTLNLFSEIGLVMLVGIVTKNSILIVEFANQLRERGLGLYDAVMQASRTRFRPILMTALSTIAGITPIALGIGAGGEARAPLGVAVVGGMFFSTILTYFVVPAVYLGTVLLRERLARGRVAPAGAPARGAVEPAGTRP
jgi:multidrug efflux pump